MHILWLALCWYIRQATDFLLKKIPARWRMAVDTAAKREEAKRRWTEIEEKARRRGVETRSSFKPPLTRGDEDTTVIWEGSQH